MTHRLAPRVAGGFSVLFILCLLDTVTGGINTRDEAWMLQVATRVANGAGLYSDVFFNTTPLAAQLAALGVTLFGSGVLVIKTLYAAAAAGYGVACALSARELIGAAPRRERTAAAVGLMAVAVGGVPGDAFYNVLAMACLATCLATTLAWLRRGDALLLVLGGAAAGIAIAVKPNVGLLVAALLGLAAVGGRKRLRWRPLGAAGMVLAVCAVGPLIPVLAEGGGPKLLEYVVAAKGQYVARAAIPYGRTLSAFAPQVRELVDRPGVAELRYTLRVGAAWLGLVALAGLALALARPPDIPRTAVALTSAAVVASLLATAPRSDVVHVGYAAPLIVVGVWLGLRAAWALVPGEPGRGIPQLAAGALVALPAAIFLAGPLSALLHRDWTASSLPHFRGVLVPAKFEAAAQATRTALVHAGDHGPVLLVTPEAGFYYLVSGLANRTPYDYPLATAFGLDGQARVARSIEAGAFPVVCLDALGVEPALRPALIERAVRRRLRRGEQVGGCRFYRAG